mgnify:CR=1 FL=1
MERRCENCEWWENCKRIRAILSADKQALPEASDSCGEFTPKEDDES